MEGLKESPILKLNPTTVYEVRKELNLHQDGVIDDMLKSFQEWIIKQNHFTKTDFSRHYLETSIISAKGSLEKAKKILDKLCTLKTLLPNFYSKYDVKKSFTDTTGFIFQATYPNLLPDNYRLYVTKVVSSHFDSEKFLDFLRFTILMSEYWKIHDYSFGFVCIVDCRDLNILNFVTKINVMDLRNSMSVLMEGYGLRVKGIHIISSSKTVDVFVSLLKQVVSAKIASRIKVHENVDSLCRSIPKEFLPEDYGGHEKSLRETHENWVNELSLKENVAFFKDIFQAGTNEKCRLAASYNEQILGMPGSFRSLNVD